MNVADVVGVKLVEDLSLWILPTPLNIRKYTDCVSLHNALFPNAENAQLSNDSSRAFNLVAEYECSCQPVSPWA